MMKTSQGLVSIPVSLGELFDKLSVLNVKSKKIFDSKKLKHINYEKSILEPICKDYIKDYPILSNYLSDLELINSSLWEVLERQRVKENNQQLDDDFILLSIDVYKKNDDRFKIKDLINKSTNSSIQEQKYYTTHESLN